MNTVSVRVSYRPIRLGMCIAEDALEDLRKAVRLNSTLWGGRFNPIIPIGNVEFARTLVRTFRVDALFAVSDAPQVANFIASINFLPWPDVHRQLFIQGAGGPLPVFLDVYHPLRELAGERAKYAMPALNGGMILRDSLTRWKTEASPLSDALLCTFGDYPDGDYCPIDYGAFAHRLLGTQFLSITPGESLPSDCWKRRTPIMVTEHGLLVYKGHGGWDTPGVFVGNPALFSDLVAYWNLRAADIDLLFLPETAQEQSMALAAAQSWMEDISTFLRKTEQEPLDIPAIWSTRDQDEAAYRGVFGGKLVCCVLSAFTWNGMNVKPPRVHFQQQSVLGTIDESDGEIAVAFPVPAKPFLDAPETSYQHAMLTARALIDADPTVGTFHYPYIPQLNEFYGRRVYFDPSRARTEPDGLGVVVGLHQSDLRLSGISPVELITQVFALAGIAAKQSSAGKVALRVIQHMGGLDSCRVFKIKGVRSLLREFGPSKAFSHKQAQARIGPGFEAHRGLFIEPREHRDLLPQDVFLHLVKKRVIRPGVELECPACQLTEWHSLGDLAEIVTCPYCGRRFDSGPQLRDGAWFYRVSGIFAWTRDHEGAIPAILALMQALRCLLMRGMTWLTGMDMSWDEAGTVIDGETDLVVLTQNYDDVPELVIGECKTGMEIKAEQVDKLVTAAGRFADAGVKTYVMFAKAGGPFTGPELELIDGRQTIDLNFILLTPSELEPYDPYEKLKSDKIRHVTPLTLEEWASYSRELYLKTKPDQVVERHLKARRSTGS